MERAKFILDEKDMPTQWYNIQADLPEPLPPLLPPVPPNAISYRLACEQVDSTLSIAVSDIILNSTVMFTAGVTTA